MGFNFVTEPTEHEKQIINLKKQMEGLESEIAKLNEFLELVGRGHLYDLWKDGLYDPKGDTTVDQYVDFEDLSIDDVASLENEK